MHFADIQAVVMDMDGVLWRGDEALPGLHAWFDLLCRKRLPFALATNNSSKSQLDYVHKLEKMGVTGVRPEQVITSGTAAISYLQMHYPPGSPIHVLGGDGLREIVTGAGFVLADGSARAVVVGLDPQLTYDKLKRAAYCIRGGTAFVGTNDDATFPMPDGLAPGAGSIIAALKTATGIEPVVIGKPNAPMFETALRVLGTTPAHTLMLGDRLNTDIEGAARLGLRTAMVLTGVSTRAEVAASPHPPDGIYDGLPELIQDWES